MTLEKGFWFKPPLEEDRIDRTKMALQETGISFYPPITASLLEPANGKDFLRLADILVARQLLSDIYITRIFTTLISCSQFIFRDTYDRSSPTSFLTREDMLVIASEIEEIPIHLSVSHIFIELKDFTQFEWAAEVLATYGVDTDQPKPLPLRKRSPTDLESLSYVSKYDVFCSANGSKKRPVNLMQHNIQYTTLHEEEQV